MKKYICISICLVNVASLFAGQWDGWEDARMGNERKEEERKEQQKQYLQTLLKRVSCLPKHVLCRIEDICLEFEKEQQQKNDEFINSFNTLKPEQQKYAFKYLQQKKQ